MASGDFGSMFVHIPDAARYKEKIPILEEDVRLAGRSSPDNWKSQNG